MTTHSLRRGALVHCYDRSIVGQVTTVGSTSFGVHTTAGIRWIRNEAVLSVEETGVYLICGREGLHRYDAVTFV